MNLLTKEEAQDLLKNKPGRKGVIEYADQINKLEKGGALHFTSSDWKRKTPPTYYFPAKFNKDGVRVVSVSKIGDGEFLVTKL